MGRKKEKFYAYSLNNGKKMGITNSWEYCESLVKGKHDAKYKSFYTEHQAHDWLINGADYSYKPVNKSLAEGIYFDAGTGRGIGVEVRVTDEKGNSLLPIIADKKDINKYGNYLAPKDSTNNYGELAGCYAALKIALKQGIKNIYGDSQLVINCWSEGRFKSKELHKKTMVLIEKVSELRKKFESDGGKIDYISGDLNPADLGFHR